MPQHNGNCLCLQYCLCLLRICMCVGALWPMATWVWHDTRFKLWVQILHISAPNAQGVCGSRLTQPWRMPAWVWIFDLFVFVTFWQIL